MDHNIHITDLITVFQSQIGLLFTVNKKDQNAAATFLFCLQSLYVY